MALPSAENYERSFMHKDIVTECIVTATDFLITSSLDGHVKFWKLTVGGSVEFVKSYLAHQGPVAQMAASADGAWLATVSTIDKTLKLFDVVNFDMINVVQLDFEPMHVCWVSKRGQASALVAVSDRSSSSIHIFDGKANRAEAVQVVTSVHSTPAVLIKYSDLHNCVVSCDTKGMVEYWTPDEALAVPSTIEWKFKSDTDLYDFARPNACPSSLSFSLDQSKFVTFGDKDGQVRVYRFTTGKLLRTYDESFESVSKNASNNSLDLSREKELVASEHYSRVNAIFDESGNFVIYTTAVGIKVVNTVSNTVCRVLGKSEGNRFLNICLHQGSVKKTGLTLAMAASDNPALQKLDVVLPVLVCTAFKKHRFYLFTKHEPDADGPARDVLNEKSSRHDQLQVAQATKPVLGSLAIMRTSVGDIILKLNPNHAPNAVENFVVHARAGYFDGHLFHRVIKGFMIQTGDPNGNGSGGESIWGHDFADEFNNELRHSQPFTLSMANAGPNTNGSQFFITTVATVCF